MAIALYAKDTKNLILNNVVIRGFDIGIALENSRAILNRVSVTKTNMGLLARNSIITLNQSIFTDNIIDILADNASIEFIDTFARRVISYLTTIKIYHYSVDPYKMIAQAMDILRERDTRKKREKFKKLLETIMQYATYVTTLYELIDMIKTILNQ